MMREKSLLEDGLDIDETEKKRDRSLDERETSINNIASSVIAF